MSLRKVRSDSPRQHRAVRPGGGERPHRVRGNHRRLHQGSCRSMTTTSDSCVRVPHVVKGERLTGADRVHGSAGGRFATPELDLNSLVWPRGIPGPAFDVPVAEIIDVLVQVGNWLAKDPKGLLEEALVSA